MVQATQQVNELGTIVNDVTSARVIGGAGAWSRLITRAPSRRFARSLNEGWNRLVFKISIPSACLCSLLARRTADTTAAGEGVVANHWILRSALQYLYFFRLVCFRFSLEALNHYKLKVL